MDWCAHRDRPYCDWVDWVLEEVDKSVWVKEIDCYYLCLPLRPILGKGNSGRLLTRARAHHCLMVACAVNRLRSRRDA